MSNLGVCLSWLWLAKPVQIASGRRRQATRALHHSIGAAAASVNLPTGSRKSINGAVRVRMQSGMQSSKTQDRQKKLQSFLQGMHIYRRIQNHGWTECDSDTEDGDQQFTVLHVDNQLKRAWDWVKNVHSSVHALWWKWVFFWVFWVRNWIIVRELFCFGTRKDPGFTHKHKVGEERRGWGREWKERERLLPPPFLERSSSLLLFASK